jgi:hypothetical protein
MLTLLEQGKIRAIGNVSVRQMERFRRAAPLKFRAENRRTIAAQ